MKLCKLKLKNLNSFRREIELDFEKSPLGDASLVAITGPTGAGKTTLLDAICVALYGKTPRLSGTTSQHPRHLISHGETEGFAEVHFETNGTRYHATWSIRRNGSPKGQLFNDSGELITTRVPQEIGSILGLDFGAFRRSVMLAQGEFAAFLKASKEHRRTILEATAGIHIYDVLRQTLNDKIREVEAASANVLARLDKIPEASPAQLNEAERELDRLKSEAEALNTESQEVQQEKDREAKRKEDYEKLQSSEERQAALLDMQSEIDALQSELENAQRAERLRPEKQAYDAAKSDLEKAEAALSVAAAEKTDAEEQVKTDQTDFDEKEEAYQTTSTEHTEKTAIYTAAKLDVARAADQFAEAEKQTAELADLDDNIDKLSSQLTDKESEQADLQKRIDEAQTFLNENHLPTDRQKRLTDASSLLTQLSLQEDQLETMLTTKVQHDQNMASLKREIKELSKTREEQFVKKTNAEVELETATAELNKLLTSGTREEWTDRKQQLAQAYPFMQRYEDMMEELKDMSERSRELTDTISTLNAGLEQIEEELQEQEIVCQRAAEVVHRCDAALRSALLANPINQLRQHLHTGDPCLVCGATEHPFADVVEAESENLLQDAEAALANAKAYEQASQDQRQNLRTKQVQLQQDVRNSVSQMQELAAEAEAFGDESKSLQRQWDEIYPDRTISFDWVAEDVTISSNWIVEQITDVDIAISALGEADQARTQASFAYQTATQQFDTCENDIAREEESLNHVKKQLQDTSDTIADLQADIKSTTERFWEFLPETFHGVAPNVAVDQFNEKIEEVATHKDELDTAKTDLKLLDTKIEADQKSLESLQQDRADLQDEIDEYRREGNELLDTVREKTEGLETEDEIDAAIKQLEAALKAKEEAWADAHNQLQESQKLLTQKQTTHGHCKEQCEESTEKFKTARDTYFEKLSDVEFDSPEAHDNAFRDEAQMQELTEQIDAHEDEKQQLALDIARLRTRFEETPFDPEALERIETEVAEIGEQLQTKQQEVGAQQQRIDHLKDALKKREALGSEVRKAEAELIRWKNLQDIIPASSLRDFALEIMFKQMGNLANEQLKFLTSERYQLKVETIGDLSVIDRWNANEERPVETLSGGESFLTSLALALALADLSRGRAQLNSLFLDEGFGTLDAETLDTAIAALEGLRMQGRSIFLISHIQELTRRLPVKINVRKRGDGSSSVQVQG